MKRLAPVLLSLSLWTLVSCGGDSASSETSMDVSAASTEVPVTNGATSPSTDGVSTEPPTSPMELLVEASYDIEAIDGPVVLWFWAPG